MSYIIFVREPFSNEPDICGVVSSEDTAKALADEYKLVDYTSCETDDVDQIIDNIKDYQC